MRDVYEIRTEEFYLRIVSLIGSSCEALPKSFTDLLIAKSSVENLRRLSSGNKKFYSDASLLVHAGREERDRKFVVE